MPGNRRMTLHLSDRRGEAHVVIGTPDFFALWLPVANVHQVAPVPRPRRRAPTLPRESQRSAFSTSYTLAALSPQRNTQHLPDVEHVRVRQAVRRRDAHRVAAPHAADPPERGAGRDGGTASTTSGVISPSGGG